MRRRGLAWSWLACALLGACGKTDQGQDRPGGVANSEGAAADLAAWNLAVAEALCLQDSSCPVLTPRMYPSFEACVDEKHTSIAGYFAYYAGLDHYAEQASVLQLGSLETRQSCLEGLAACKTWADSGCDGVLVPRGRVARGESCATGSWTTSTPCEDGLFCSGTVGCSMCQSKALAGERCEDRQCAPGLFCHRTFTLMGDVGQEGPSYCDREREAGEACGEVACAPGLVCSSGTCRAFSGPDELCEGAFECPSFYECIERRCTRLDDRKGVGEACPAGASCAATLTCIDGVCSELLPEGAACQRGPYGTTPGCQRWCVFDTPDAEQGHCTSSPPTAAPLPCSIYRWEARMTCPAGTLPNSPRDTSQYPNFPGYCQCERVENAESPMGASCE